jgi:hypothetical protein
MTGLFCPMGFTAAQTKLINSITLEIATLMFAFRRDI